MKGSLKLLYTLIFSLFILSCNDDERPTLVIPQEYDGTNFAINAAPATGLTGKLSELVTKARTGRTGAAVSATELFTIYSSGSPSLQSAITTFYHGKLSGDAGYMNQLALASGNTYTPGTPTGNGGTYGGYLFDENGVEPEQLIDKGQFGATLYHQALSLLNQPLTVAQVDQVLALYGAHPDFANSNDATKHTNPDRFLANYAARRDKNDGTGLYTTIRDNFLKLRAAVLAGSDYRKEQEEAIAAIKENWEKANAATIINYCHDIIARLTATTVTDAAKAGALHAHSENIGFIMGWRTIADADKIITDAQIDEILTLMNAPVDGTPSPYLFVTNSAQELTKITQIIDKLQDIYGFTDQQIEDFKFNWVSVQAR